MNLEGVRLRLIKGGREGGRHVHGITHGPGIVGLRKCRLVSFPGERGPERILVLADFNIPFLLRRPNFDIEDVGCAVSEGYGLEHV